MLRRICIGRWRKLGVLLLTLGTIIILALIMPPIFWCFAIGVALICAGIALLRH